MLKPIVRRFCGLRPVRYLSVFEALVTAITAQQVNLTFAGVIRRRLVERWGERMISAESAISPFPAPSAWLGRGRRRCGTCSSPAGRRSTSSGWPGRRRVDSSTRTNSGGSRWRKPLRGRSPSGEWAGGPRSRCCSGRWAGCRPFRPGTWVYKRWWRGIVSGKRNWMRIACGGARAAGRPGAPSRSLTCSPPGARTCPLPRRIKAGGAKNRGCQPGMRAQDGWPARAH